MQIIDAFGKPLLFKQAAQRIISLVPSYTQTLFEIGAGEKVVGRTKYCIHPKKSIGQIPIVGGTKQVKDIALIQSLKPDLILCNKEENTPEMVAQLEQIAPVWVSEIQDLKDNQAFLKQLGVVTQCETKTLEINDKIATAFDSIKDINTIYSTLYLIWRAPFMAAATATFIDCILNQGGFTNVLNGQKRYPTLEMDELKTLNPEIVMLSSEPYPFKTKHIFEIQALLPNAKVILVDGERFSWHGSGIIKTPEYLKYLRNQL